MGTWHIEKGTFPPPPFVSKYAEILHRVVRPMSRRHHQGDVDSPTCYESGSDAARSLLRLFPTCKRTLRIAPPSSAQQANTMLAASLWV
jgi:hypothetical protein